MAAAAENNKREKTMTEFERAEAAQKSFDFYYRSDDPNQLYNNTWPMQDIDKDSRKFNYWWLAHLMDVRLDGYLRSKDEAYLESVIEIYRYSKNRNGCTLLHEYYDDMLWNALALLRLHEINGERLYFDEADLIWHDLTDTGWNDYCGGGFAWKKTQLSYKNTPVNAPFIILSCRLYRLTKKQAYLDWAQKAYEWMQKTLVREADGFVEDGINRLGDGALDGDWRFTYNQGVWIGANVEFALVTGEKGCLNRAEQTAKAAVSLLTLPDHQVFTLETQGGDVGLFKGIFYRYLGLLLKERDIPELRRFIDGSTNLLWKNCYDGAHLLPSGDWREPARGNIDFSVFLSGIMAIEINFAIKG